MNIDISCYRARIGTFVPRYQQPRKIQPTTKQYKSRKSPTNLFRKVLFLVLMSSLTISLLNIYRTNTESREPDSNFKTTLESTYRPNYSIESPGIEDFNFLARYVNGNKRRNGIKLAHINLGGGYLINKINEVENIIAGYKPHVLGISETRFQDFHNIDDLYIQDYSVYFSKTLQNPSLKTSRIAVFVHKDIVVRERSDLMSDEFSSVWLELGLPRQKKNPCF